MSLLPNKEQNAALEAERVAFEAAYMDLRGCLSADVLVELRRGKDYASTDGERLNIAWRVWQQARAQLAAPAGVADEWSVTKPAGAGVRETDRWEIYGPDGGGVVHTADVTDWVVRQLLDALAAAPSPTPADCQHPDDVAVDLFATTMKSKLALARAKGRGGWDDKSQCSAEYLSRLLRGHVDKGDPVDVANFCMMLSQRGEGIAPAPASDVVQVPRDITNQCAETCERAKLCATCAGALSFPGLPEPGSIAEAIIPHHTRDGRQMLWTEVEVIAHAIIQGVIYSWVKEPGESGGFYAPMMLSFRALLAKSEGVKP